MRTVEAHIFKKITDFSGTVCIFYLQTIVNILEMKRERIYFLPILKKTTALELDVIQP